VIDDMELSSSDQELVTEINTALIRFIKSGDSHMQLEPMNSYRRRMVHKIGTKFKLASESIGEGDRRSVRLEKTDVSAVPEKIHTKKIFDRGIEIFYSKPGEEIVLRNDGSFGIFLKERESSVLDKRIVEDGEFRIRENKIICKDDSNW